MGISNDLHHAYQERWKDLTLLNSTTYFEPTLFWDIVTLAGYDTNMWQGFGGNYRNVIMEGDAGAPLLCPSSHSWQLVGIAADLEYEDRYSPYIGIGSVFTTLKTYKEWIEDTVNVDEKLPMAKLPDSKRKLLDSCDEPLESGRDVNGCGCLKIEFAIPICILLLIFY